MNLSFNAEDDKKYEESLNNAGNFVSDKDLPYVDSGLYQCEVSSAFPSQATINGVVEERINVTFIAYDKDGVTPIGKFTNNFTCDQSNKFFTKTFELCVLTGNDKGLKEEPLLNKNGEQVYSKDGVTPIMHYPTLKGTKLIASVLRKPDYTSPNTGVTYANYTVYNLYASDKRTLGEIRRNQPATSISRDYAFLQKKIKEQQEQQEALSRATARVAPAVAPVTPVTPAKPVMQEPNAYAPKNGDVDLPF